MMPIPSNDVSLGVKSGNLVESSVLTAHHFSLFAAMDTPVTIIPRFSMEAVPRLGVYSNSASDNEQAFFGPFHPHYPVEVPLYLALHFSLTSTCTIQLPKYLHHAFLSSVIEEEQADPNNFHPLPFYFFEVAVKLLEAGDRGVVTTTLPDGSGESEWSKGSREGSIAEAAQLIQQLRLVRRQKLQQSMRVLERSGSPMSIPGIKLTNIVSNELEYLQHTFALVLEQASHLDRERQRIVVPKVHGGRAQRGSTGLSTSSSVGGGPTVSGSYVPLPGDSVSLRGESTIEASSVQSMLPSLLAPTGSSVSQSDNAEQHPSQSSASTMQAPLVKKRRILRQQ